MRESGDENEDLLLSSDQAPTSMPRPRSVSLDEQLNHEELSSEFGEMVANWHEGGAKRKSIDEMRRFGQYVRTLRRECRIGIEELATRARLDLTFLLRLEGGLTTRLEAAQVLDRLAQALQVDLTVLEAALGTPYVRCAKQKVIKYYYM